MPEDQGSRASDFLPFVIVATLAPIIGMTVLVAALWGVARAAVVLGGMIAAGLIVDRIIDRLSLRQ